jgi:uncharacterized protein
VPAKTHRSEEEYFAREDALKKQKLALSEAKRLLEEQKEELKRTHWMHCPKCGMNLHTINYKGVQVDRCFSCKGTWLDEGELEKIALHDQNERKGAWVKAVLHIFGEPEKATSHPAPKKK